MILHIKNMVCDRCIMVVQQQLVQRHFNVKDIGLGHVEIEPEPGEKQLLDIGASLRLLGFELIDKEKDKLVAQIRNIIIETVHHNNEGSEINMNYSELLTQRLHKDYSYLSRLFSEHENRTIEKFIIHQKIEKVKELLEYGELNMNEIALQMGYSSSAHLSTQFKNVTGMSPSTYKQGRKIERQALDKI
jgi:AraC family transcriptional regulator